MDLQILVKVCVLLLASLCSAQQNPKSWIDFLKPESVQCLTEVRQIQFDCFKNSDLNLTLVDEYLVGRLKHSQINTQPQEFVSKLCNKRSTVAECIIKKALQKRGHGACVDGEFFNLAVQEMTQRLSMYNRACKAKNFFVSPSDPCMRTISFDIYHCYITAGLSGQMFVSNGSLEGASIGPDKETADKFCSSRFNLFNCVNDKLKKCPVAKEYYLLNGYDYDSMQESLHLLCDDTDLYLKGLECFQSPHQNVVNCVNDYTAELLDLNVKQYLDGSTREKYFKEFCMIRAKHIDCDIRAWSDMYKCQADSIGLKNQFQCKTLPKVCQNDKELKVHETTCHEDNFNLHLRNNASSIYLPQYSFICLFIFLYIGIFFS